MEDRAEALRRIKESLARMGLPFETLNVFGVMRINVHVTCLSADAAGKWSAVLSKAFDKAPAITKTRWPAVHNKNTCLKPTMRSGYLVVLAA